MQISADKVVLIHYTLTNNAGEVLDSSAESGEPLAYLHGHFNIVPGLESELEGLSAGAKKKVVVAPEDGYGLPSDDAIHKVPQSEFPAEIPREVGLQIFAEGPGGQHFPLWIKAVDDAFITVDGNHPLAGETLNFDVEVVEVRDASEEEIAHGHVHGPGGHEH